MPYKFNPKQSVKANIENVQKIMKSADFKNPEKFSAEARKEAFASVFAMRMTAEAEKGKTRTLRKTVSAEQYQVNYNALMNSAAFNAYLEKHNNGDELRTMLVDGHGGSAEEDFQKYVLESQRLPTDVPARYMPTAEARIDHLKTKLNGVDPRSDEAIILYSEIFQARQAVNAVRNKSSSLAPTVTGMDFAETTDLSSNAFFRDYVDKNGASLKTAALSGHGGAAVDLFKDHIRSIEHIPENAPAYYMPTAAERIDSLKAKINQGGSDAEQFARYTEIMATRDAVNAARKKADSLAPQINPKLLNDAYKTWSDCKTFQDYLNDNKDEAKTAATTGHGGLLQDKFRDHVKQLDHIAADVPASYVPSGYERLEELKKKYEGDQYYENTPERKLTLAAEIMATRDAVDAERGKADSLKKPLDPVRLNRELEKWTNCRLFKQYVQSTDAKTAIEVRDAAHAGHGGALGDKFKEYLLKQDELDDDIPPAFMPNALTRTEALRKTIEKNENITPERRKKLYTELMATRMAVNAIRKKKSSLEQPLDPATLKQERKKLEKCAVFQNFLNDEQLADKLRSAATAGHGGELEDKFQEYLLAQDHIPEDVPERYMPTALERTEALQEKIGKLNPDALTEEQVALFAEMMVSREAVGAKRGKAKSLDVTIEPAKLKTAVDSWKGCQTFINYIKDHPAEAKKAATAGHGGELGDKFQEYVKNMDVIPTDVPEKMLPDTFERIGALKKKIDATKDPNWPGTDEQELSLYAQLLAARSAADAVRGKADSLKKPFKPAEVNETADKLMKSKAFQDFFDKNSEKARQFATSGNGGQLEDAFKYYVKTMVQLPLDVPMRYIPTAKDRIEGLQSQINSDKFQNAEPDVKAAIYAEVLGARRAVNAVRKKADTLDTQLQPEEVRKHSAALAKCEAFKKYIEDHPEEAKKAATSGHAGELEDKFRNYVLHLDRIPGDVPKEYMPSALERAEVLQKKIKSSTFQSLSAPGQNALYKELAATRAAVDSIRGDKKSLNAPMDAQKLHNIRLNLNTGVGPDKFFDTANRKVLYDAATAGHGGALEDLIKKDVLRQTVEEGKLPTEVDERYRPKAADVRDSIRAGFQKHLKDRTTPDQNQLKHQVAAMMYITKLEKHAAENHLPAPELNAEDMEKNVDKLVASPAFQKMFQGIGAPQRIMQQSSARMSEVFTAFAGNEAQIRHEQALQRQRELEQQRRQQQQQLNNQNQPQVNNQNQPQVNNQNQQQLDNQNQPQVGLQP